MPRALIKVFGGGGWVLKATLVFCFGPSLKLWFWPRPKLNNIPDMENIARIYMSP